MSWLSPELYQQCLYAVFAFTAFMLCVLLIFDAPYGRRDNSEVSRLWGPSVPLKLGWFILEAPVFISFPVFFFLGDHCLSPIPIVLFLLWEGHYFHRTFIYPMSLKAKPGSGFRLAILFNGIILNSLNGFINGWYISQYADHLYEISWLWDPRFIIGIAIFIAGFSLCKQSDAILAQLRKPGETAYKIPHGGLYRWVSNPNYLGELIQWCGFAIACWSLPALAFVCICIGNLLPRAISNHRWYHENFKDYPKQRKSLIPFII